MEKKKEMGFLEKFEAAVNELEKEINDGRNMIMIAVDEERKDIYAVINGDGHKISALLAYTAIRVKNFKGILMDAIIALEMIEQKNK